ncbi:hypothetical protein OS127_02840 [Corynebacterium sp. P6129]|uniref:hypothetical protein n=1 Tax=Corynebacterium antarcticum TaxID=2800405 RepID=UPI002260ED59|nr:hypothetical protein [Corynebacterium antarcticum]MCX7491466.1 hypothetical protein [Corynebacterium antarcticum]
MFDLIYTSPSGRTWHLSRYTHEGVFVDEGGVEGLVGAVEEQVFASVGRAGQRLAGQQAQPLSGGLSVSVVGTADRSVMDAWLEFRADWSVRVPGTLTVVSPVLGSVSTPVRLREVPAAPTKFLEPGAGDSMSLRLVGDDGVWWGSWLRVVSSGGDVSSVTVTNPGDVTVWPRLRVDRGCTGTITLPSGKQVSMTVPDDDERAAGRWLLLDESESCAVLDENDRIDRALWLETRPGVVTEGVPPGTERTYRIQRAAGDGTVAIEWRPGYMDPWR